MKYIYVAVFTPEQSGGFSVNFPDLESCYTCGDTLEESIEMAEDVLALTLYEYEAEGKRIPPSTSIHSLKCTGDSFATLICCDTLQYQRKFSKRAVKKTLTIPSWMNDEAINLGLNFSQILQEALMQKLGIK